jgi:hypothetical protein
VAALLGISQTTVQRDAAWLRLPEAVRSMVGSQGFTVRHALALVPGLMRFPERRVEGLLREYRRTPCSVPDFEKRVVVFFSASGRPRATGVRMSEGLLRIDEKKLNPDAMGQADVRALLARLDGVRGRLSEWLAAQGDAG